MFCLFALVPLIPIEKARRKSICFILKDILNNTMISPRDEGYIDAKT